MTNPTPNFTPRQILLADLRAKYAIAKTRANLLKAAIEVLTNPRGDDESAVELAKEIADAPIGL